MDNGKTVTMSIGDDKSAIASPDSWPLSLAGHFHWQIEVQASSHPWKIGEKKQIDSKKLTPSCQAVKDGTTYLYTSLGDDTAFCGLVVQLEIRRHGEALHFSASLQNHNADWTVTSFTFPVLDGIETTAASILWPNGLGQRFDTPSGFGQRTLHYPSGEATMPWFALATADAGGLYFGSHDAGQGVRDLEAAVSPENGRLAVKVGHQPFCAPGGKWQAPEFVIAPYQGAWQNAARHYRAWYDTVKQVRQPPAWARNSAGWLLAILKQQNGDVMWDYLTGIDRLCDLAEARGLGMIGLFGWAHGGHDYLYPDYTPDPLMGGETALRAALARARQRGIRTILYANGIIMDTSTSFYRECGNEAIMLCENSEPYVSSIRKFHSSTPVTFALGCPGSDCWRGRMLKLAEQANDLGADGILYDQLGVFCAVCHATDHRHTTPVETYGERAGMLREIADCLQEQNPDFVVMTEGIHDTLLDSISFVHGWGCGFASAGARHNMFGDNSFPALFRVTFPEVPMTQRQPNCVLDRHQANFATVHGIRHEIETRYQPDVRYLLEGTVPDLDAYADCAYYPPDVELMRRTNPEQASRYLANLIAFQQRYAEFFRHGRFLGNQGFACDNTTVQANAFAGADGKLAVCVWNPTELPQPCTVVVPKHNCVECAEPECSAVQSRYPLNPETIRIFIFTKQNGSGQADK